MSLDTVFILCGIFNLGFALFHVLFWKIFRWGADLRSLIPANRAIMQVMNLCLIFLFLFFGALTIYYNSQLLATELGKTILLAISLFWLFRAIEQPVFFDFNNLFSRIIFFIFIIGSILHFIPLVM
jgi:hypothetical protein